MSKKNSGHISLIYSGHQFAYLYGILSGFYNKDRLIVDVIDAVRPPDETHDFNDDPNLRVKNFLGLKRKTKVGKLLRWIGYYSKLIAYLLTNRSEIIHIEWLNSQFESFEQLMLPLIIKMRGQKLVYKVHDISSRLLLRKETSGDYHINIGFIKRHFYNKVDVFIVHNNYIKKLLISFGIPANKIEIISHGVNNHVPFTNKSKNEARKELGISKTDKVILFFGTISPYKNIEALIDSIHNLKKEHENILLLIAGEFRDEKYKKYIEEKCNDPLIKNNIVKHIGHIKNKDIENYFAAADVLCLPYKFIFQSGVLFLAYRLGTFVISRNVGGIPEDILVNTTGVIYEDDSELPKVLSGFFNSELYQDERTGKKIRDYANEKYSWEKLSGELISVYNKLIPQ